MGRGLNVRSPSRNRIEDYFGRLRALLWGLFEILLLALAMAAVIAYAWSHIPAGK